MDRITISIFGNKILSEVLKEIKLFSKYNIKFYDDLNLCIRNAAQNNYLVIFFITKSSKKDCKELIKHNFPLIVIKEFLIKNNNLTGEFIVSLTMPFSILYLEKKIISLLARYEFNKRSLINLHDYTIDKNERKIKKKNLELHITEKEINGLDLRQIGMGDRTSPYIHRTNKGWLAIGNTDDFLPEHTFCLKAAS